ncbi:DEAD/DEAH box helicase [bacterium]|nr:DEAD/DEAH box helicase [bacterium]
MGWVADLAEYVVGMSGTVYGGTPSTVFYLLFRLIPSFREQWDISEVDRFVSQYGNWRQRKNEDGKWGKKVALPGISPELIAGIFLNYATFITQADAGLPMPERHDIPIELTATKEEQEGLRLAADAFRAVVRADGMSHERRLNAIGTAAQQLYVAPVGFHLRELAPFSPAYACTTCGKRKIGTSDPCQHYWLRTEDELEDMAPDRRERVQAILAEPVLDPSWRSTKERTMIDFVSREREEQRVPLLYVYHTGRYKIDDRIEMVLADAGFRTINLQATQVKRLEMVVNNAAFNGIDAVITNPAKVGTGLNLTGTPSIFWYQPIWPPKLKIQASARPDRPTQTRQVRVFYPVIKGSAEAVILSRVMEKIISIYLLAGIDYEGLSEVMEAVGHTETFTEEMIRFVSQHVETDLSTMFEQLAKLDTGRTNDHEIAVYQTDQARKAIEPIDLENATQLSFF